MSASVPWSTVSGAGVTLSRLKAHPDSCCLKTLHRFFDPAVTRPHSLPAQQAAAKRPTARHSPADAAGAGAPEAAGQDARILYLHSMQTTQDIDANGQVKKTETEEGEDFFVNGHVIERNVKKNGQPLNDHDQQKETERVTKLVEKAEKTPPGQPLEGPSISVSRVLEIMDVRNERRVNFRGRPPLSSTSLAARTPRPTGWPRMLQRSCRARSGSTKPTARWRISRSASTTTSTWPAACSPISRRARTSASTRNSVNGELWLPTGGEGTVQARVLLLKNFRQHFIERDYDYKRFRWKRSRQRRAKCGISIEAQAMKRIGPPRCTLRIMFVRSFPLSELTPPAIGHACPFRWIDNFAMRNFTNDAVFDDTLPVGDGLLEAGHRVPLDRLQTGDGRLVPAQGISEGRGAAGSDGRREQEQGRKGAREHEAKTEERNLQASLLRARAPLLRRGTGPRQPSTAVKNLPGKVAVPISKGGAQLRGEPSIPDSLLRGRDPRAATARQRRRSGRN